MADLGRKFHSRDFIEVYFLGQDFLEGRGHKFAHEKFWKQEFQGFRGHPFRRRRIHVHGSQPGRKQGPNLFPEINGQMEKEAVADNSQLDEAMVCLDFFQSLPPVFLGLYRKVLVSLPSLVGFPHPHPESIGIDADGVDGGFEADLDFEAGGIEADGLHRVHVEVGGNQDDPPLVGVMGQDKTDHPFDGTPKEVFYKEGDRYRFPSVDRDQGRWKGGFFFP